MESLISSKNDSWLPWFFRGLLFFVFLVLVSRSFDLQIIRGKYYSTLAQNNHIRRVSIDAPRGRIYARGGEALGDNREIKKAILFDKNEGYIKSDEWNESKTDTFVTEYLRYYSLDSLSSHLTGYLGEAREGEIGKINPECPEKGVLKSGDILGKSGLEKYYDCKLRGVDGEELLEVGADGLKVATLGRKEAISGEDLKTYIDFGLQKKVSELLDGKKGVILVTSNNGEVLALSSSPTFEPNAFNSNNNERIIEILNSDDFPLFNRATSGKYPPGSIYKPLVAIAALEEKKIDKNFTYDDTGQILVQTAYGDFSYKNWYFTQYGSTEGTIDLRKALARSTDTFFYKIGELLGIDKIDEWSDKFGLGQLTGIDLPGEISGLVPSPDWKKKTTGEKWFLGNTYHLSIGQGDLLVTPLEIHRALMAIANEGKFCSPRIAGNIDCKNLPISKINFDYVREGMKMACASGGTGYTFFDANPSVGCKTGTAQTFDNSEPHSWFNFFAPFDDPEIVVTVMIEHGGEGSKVAGPIAREVYDYWFGR